MNFKIFILAFGLALFISGCGKDVSEYNKPAAYWYEKMVDAVANNSLEKADGYFSSLQSEHIGSPLLEQATMIMAQAHMEVGEYMLAEHFLDEYIRRYANTSEREFAEYLKMRAKFMALPNPRRDQTLIHDALREGEAYKVRYPRSYYLPAVDTMLVKLYLARANLNQTISGLYERLDKPVAEAYYAKKEPETWINWNQVEPPNTAWYREMFEGDGTSSWYAYLLPDTTSVIAQDADGNAKNTTSEDTLSPFESDTYEDNLRPDEPLD